MTDNLSTFLRHKMHPELRPGDPEQNLEGFTPKTAGPRGFSDQMKASVKARPEQQSGMDIIDETEDDEGGADPFSKKIGQQIKGLPPKIPARAGR